jgi:trans-2,3-dihydro-3-hydroxyanthranilate isomerase
MARTYRYLLLDVFTETALTGNQLAVFLDAAGMSDVEMQAVARETRLSETTFCLPSEADACEAVRVRIFTTGEELAFAGHPTLGTATALRMAIPALTGANEVRLRLNAGTIPVRFASDADAEREGGLHFGIPVRGVMEQLLPVFGSELDREAVAAAIGLSAEALDPSKLIQVVSTGTAFAIVPLASLEALGALRVDLTAARRVLGDTARFFYVLAPANADGTRWRARMQFYNGEDPATGSASGCATAYLVHHGFAPEDTPLVIEQGIEIHRPSVIETSARLHAETATPSGGSTAWKSGSYVRVGGATVLVGEGYLHLP